ncbi:hypothetical protein PUNSTDRAFT_50856 [Punctularia strigosozonata HHB-11173 SS5]|uniref:uncharacterized protein n=1 Tax=Punctularia strigosozonata (strain HHB-11173) TaxID=741275 RepID=UPI000441852D|nr:uncharacterized protein PUNSTDRAFT_50856 [Punctularia strigosozonata HHB-11173 SS5]EIN10140.1 hypothetical protein PUNSTDRAFT_50856 [Punctularia strigosozonata HHB-11173 SS5]
MAGRAALFASLLPAALAFSDTLPVVAWTSHRSSLLDSFDTSHGSNLANVVDRILSADDLCAHDAVIVVDQPGLHASDLRTLAPSTLLAQNLASAPSSLQLPYVAHSGANALRTSAERLAARCGSSLTRVSPGSFPEKHASSSKHVVCVDMPHLMHDGSGAGRKNAVATHEAMLSDALHNLATLFPDHLVLLTGSVPSSSLRNRQFDSDPELAPLPGPVVPQSLPPLENATSQLVAPSNVTFGDGIFARYQLLTTPLITSLLVAFFVVVPAVMLGISALASIQAPRMDAPGAKGFNADVKKNQ